MKVDNWPIVSSLPRFSCLCVSDGVTFASSQVSATVVTSSIQDEPLSFIRRQRHLSAFIGFCPIFIEALIQVAGYSSGKCLGNALVS
jgi:hypothetical protein